MKLRLRFRSRQPQTVQRVRQVQMTEVQLQLLLDKLVFDADALRPSARELMDYFDGRGEFANYVELAARHEDVRHLLAWVARSAYYSEHECSVQDSWLVEGDEDDFVYHDAHSEPD